MIDLLERGGRADRDEAGAPLESPGEDSAQVLDRATSRSRTKPLKFRPELLDHYEGTGHELIKLNSPDAMDVRGRPIGKAPMGSKWRLSPALTLDEAREHMASGGNIGVRLREDDLVVDVDPRNFKDGDEPLVRLAADLGTDLADYPTVITGSGGKHIYMKKPTGVLLRDTVEAYQGIEFKACGRQVVAAGSVHPTAREAYVWDDDPLALSLHEVREAPPALIALAKRPEVQAGVVGGSRSPEELAVMLTGLKVMDYSGRHDPWLQIMMACHHATGGDGRDEFIDWSTSDPAYSDRGAEIGRRWDSLHADAGGRRVTEKTLFKALVDAGRPDLLPRGNPADDFADDSDEAELGDEPRSVFDDWVWVADAAQFVRRSDGKKYRCDQWKSLFAPEFPDGDILNAVWKEKVPVRKFESLIYVPGLPEFPDAEGERGRYNLWRSAAVTPIEGDVGPFLRHVAHLFPDSMERGYVLDFLAMLVQRPDLKINFALLIQGAQGTGKSWLGQMVEAIIGSRNVVRPSNDEVVKNWTIWMEGSQLAVIEELMTLGRREVANRLKPAITDPTLRIVEKNCTTYSIPNHLNFLVFTNHEDALPIEKGDRRWLVIFSPAEPLEDAYYDALFGYLQGPGPAAVAHWLMQRHVELNPKGRAPSTNAKAAMERASLDEVEDWMLDRVQEREWPFDFDLVRIEDVLSVLPSEVRLRNRGTKQRVAKALRSIGAVAHDRYTKGDRPAYQLWSVRSHEEWVTVGAAKRIDAFQARDGQ